MSVGDLDLMYAYKQGYRDGFSDGQQVSPPSSGSGPSKMQPRYLPQCKICGMTFDAVMGYVCSRIDCPSAARFKDKVNPHAV